MIKINKLEPAVRNLLVATIGLQAVLLGQIYSGFLEIDIIKLSFIETSFLIAYIMGSPVNVVNFLRERALGTLFFMNTTLLLVLLGSRDRIDSLIKKSLIKLAQQVYDE